MHNKPKKICLYENKQELRKWLNMCENMWQLSKVKLPCAIRWCECILIETDRFDPTLIVIGGQNDKHQKCDNHWEFKMSSVIGLQNTHKLFLTKKNVKCVLHINVCVFLCLPNKMFFFFVRLFL